MTSTSASTAPGAIKPRPVLRWPGAKWQLAPWIVAHLPAHRAYLEPFAGSAAVLFHKRPAPFEVLNDLDGEVVNLFRVMRDQPDELAAALALTPYARQEYQVCRDRPPDLPPAERARRFVADAFQGMGSVVDSKAGWRVQAAGGRSAAVAWATLPSRVRALADRLRMVQVECRPALEVIERMRDPEVLIYADPPYLVGARHDRLYATGDDMTDAAHAELIAALRLHPGPVLLSGYLTELYAELLPDWQRLTVRAKSRGGSKVEGLWLNHAASRQGRLGL